MNINIAVLEDIPKHYKQLAEVIHNSGLRKRNMLFLSNGFTMKLLF